MSKQQKPIWGKVLFGLVFLIKGWAMGLLGVMLGHYLIDARIEKTLGKSDFTGQRRKQGRFIFHLFTLSAKVAKSKGNISRSEIVFMEKLMRNQFHMNATAREEAVQIWKRSKDSNIPFEFFAQKFYEEFRTDKNFVFQMMDFLFAIASADRHLYPQQEQILLKAAAIFQISRLQYNRIKLRYFTASKPPPTARPAYQTSPYKTLGAAPSDSLDEIKKKYRKLAMRYHPDKVTASGATEKEIEKAQRKFQAINEAYEKITSSRQI